MTFMPVRAEFKDEYILLIRLQTSLNRCRARGSSHLVSTIMNGAGVNRSQAKCAFSLKRTKLVKPSVRKLETNQGAPSMRKSHRLSASFVTRDMTLPVLRLS